MQIDRFEKDSLPRIKKDLGTVADAGDLLLMAIMQDSTKNIFFEIQKEFPDGKDLDISTAEITNLATCYETAKSLAWIGDTTIKYAILSTIWKPGISPQKLHDAREKIERNKNLANLCNS